MSRRREALHTKTFTQVQMQMNSGAPSSQAGTEFGTELRGISVILCSLDSKWFAGDLYHLPSIFRRTVSSQGFFLTQDLENHVKFEPRLFLMGNQTDFLERGKKKTVHQGKQWETRHTVHRNENHKAWIQFSRLRFSHLNKDQFELKDF